MVDSIKLNSILEELKLMRTRLQDLNKDAKKNMKEWRQFNTEIYTIGWMADDIKCEALWLSQWMSHLENS